MVRVLRVHARDVWLWGGAEGARGSSRGMVGAVVRDACAREWNEWLRWGVEVARISSWSGMSSVSPVAGCKMRVPELVPAGQRRTTYALHPAPPPPPTPVRHSREPPGGK